MMQLVQLFHFGEYEKMYIQSHSRDLLSYVYGPRNLSTNREPGRLLFDKQLKVSNHINLCII